MCQNRRQGTVLSSVNLLLSIFATMTIFGHYMTADDLERLKHYRYTSGQLTIFDRMLTPFWEFCAKLVPRWLAPNVLTLLGLLSSLIGFVVAISYAPSMTEAIPPTACWVIALSIFMYQTLDAIDGKHARQTGTSSPLGTLFDHGCDIFTGPLLTGTIVAITGNGLGFWGLFSITSSIKIIQFLCFWWEYHFNVFNCNPGNGMGPTEAQLFGIFAAIIHGVWGLGGFRYDILPLFPKRLQFLIPAVTSFHSIRVNKILFVLVVTSNFLGVIYMIINGLSKLPTRKLKGFVQVASFLAMQAFEWIFYQSTLLRRRVWLPLVLLTLTSVYAIVCTRMLLASTSRRYYHSLQWPAAPFCIVTLLMYCSQSLSPALASWIDANFLWLILGLLSWQLIYLADLITTSINDMCDTLQVQCFVIPHTRKRA